MSDINNLSCSRVLHFFEKISKIPRESGNEKKVSDFIAMFAKDRGFYCFQDEANNLIIKKPATVDALKNNTVILQSHLDMVCEKNKISNHDFSKDPIAIIYDGDFIRADNTTLGADNGIGVSMCLALLDSETIPHPNLEVVLTADEEVGMNGASALDFSKLDGKILLNIDSDEEGVFTLGCAGGIKTSLSIPYSIEAIKPEYSSFALSITGLKGGHSGIDINKERANSIRLLARILSDLMKEFDIQVSSIFGGAKDNAIPRESESIVSVLNSDIDKVKLFIEEKDKIFKNEFRNSDKNISLKFEETEVTKDAIVNSDIVKIISALMLIPNGVQSMSTDIEGLVESSNNIGVLKINEDEISIVCALRSSVAAKKHYILEQMNSAANLCNGKLTNRGDYPAWEYKQDSKIRDICIEKYKEIYTTEPKTEIIHAGLECGIFAKNIENIDMVSFGPNLYDIHTPDEKASISSIERTWKYLLSVLEADME